MPRLSSNLLPGIIGLWGLCGLVVTTTDAAPDSGYKVERHVELVDLAPEVVDQAPQRSSSGTFTINLNAGPGLLANGAALAAWQTVVQQWEDLFVDPISITIDGDLDVLGPTTLANTTTEIGNLPYDTGRGVLIADADAAESLVNQIPTLAQLSVIVRSGFSFSDAIGASKPNFSALGVNASALADPSITFNSTFTFDYDPSDGITAGAIDFQAVAFHEIGHALGFLSVVELVDLFRSQGGTASLPLFTLDLFRFRPGDGAANFTSNPRLMENGDSEPTQVSYFGTSDLAMSTGSVYGDGQQAGHWKADELSGTFIGIMDPTLAPGETFTYTEEDILALGFIGWDRKPFSACCDEFGGCVLVASEANCSGEFLSGVEVCDPMTCFGACCNDEGVCRVTFNDDCGLGGPPEFFFGYNTDCDPNPCPQFSGACCKPDGTCEFVPTGDYCTGSGERFQGIGTSCEPNPCPPAGACCTSGDVCSFYTEDFCLDEGGQWQGAGVACDPNPCAPSDVETPGAVTALRLRAPSPNPASTLVVFGIDLPEASAVRVQILDVTGRIVDTALDSDLEAGSHSFEWDSRALELTSGVYYVRLETGSIVRSRSFVLTR